MSDLNYLKAWTTTSSNEIAGMRMKIRMIQSVSIMLLIRMKLMKVISDLKRSRTKKCNAVSTFRGMQMIHFGSIGNLIQMLSMGSQLIDKYANDSIRIMNLIQLKVESLHNNWNSNRSSRQLGKS
jgi:hypothetical protein